MRERQTYTEEWTAISKLHQGEAKADEENQIAKGYATISFERVEFQRRQAVPGRVWMCMPKTFAIMDEAQAADKYAAGERPHYIYTNEETTVDLCFRTDDEDEVQDGEIEEIAGFAAEEMKRMHPGCLFWLEGAMKANGRTVAYFGFTSPAADGGEVSRWMFFMEEGGGIVTGSLSCAATQKEEWEPLVLQMLQTLEGRRAEEEPKSEITGAEIKGAYRQADRSRGR